MRLLLLVAAALTAGCSAEGTTPDALRSGDLRYTATTLDGRPLLAGTLDIALHDDSTVTGAWAIRWLPGADTSMQVGPQVGTGSLAGQRVGDRLYIDLNPGNADHNVGLLARFSATGLEGQWEWVTFTGPRTRGLFSASRD